MTTPEKSCKWCGDQKPLDQFARDKGMRDGHKNICRKCASKRNAERKRERRMEMKGGSGPNEVLPWEAKLAWELIRDALAKGALLWADGRPRHAEALEWLLGYDLLIIDEHGFSCGACLKILELYGIAMPNKARFRDHVLAMVRGAGMQAVPVPPPPPEEDYQQVEQKGMPRDQRMTRRDRVPCGVAPVSLEEVAA